MEKLEKLLNDYVKVETEFCAISSKVVDELRNKLDGIFEGKENELLTFDNVLPVGQNGAKWMFKEDEEYYVTDTNGDAYELVYELTNSDVGAIAFAIMNGEYSLSYVERNIC